MDPERAGLEDRSTKNLCNYFRGLTTLTLSFTVGLLLLATATSDAADSRSKRGKVVLQQNCGRCHAIEAVGESPLKEAPPMRDIYTRFSPRELQTELSEGMVCRHREMPQIDFSDEDVDAILAYL